MAAANPDQCWGKDARSLGLRVGICREVMGGKVKLDPARLAVCERDALAVIATLPNNRNPAHLAERVPSCRGVGVGLVAGGGQCLGTMECEPGLVCRQMVCTAPGRAGDKCEPAIEMTMVARTSTCGDGLYCPAGDYVCAVQADAGGACTQTEGCTGTLQCRGGKCVPAAPSAAGAECDETSDCPAGHFCAVFSDRCEPRKPDGADCMLNDECQHQCVTGDSVSGTCGPCPT